ncbi:hypothetical protein [Burkholderia multivorans]|uniref:hypothetical protein n=1 Tax=Burkholderia multivorans TaxID=87883 RepID=UPI0020B3C0E2|nr:hypothetical protein [Burkholderia multivorans]UXZ84637.1 hypothetical protein NUJ31_24475 [Burkholderia multivorans]
MNDASIAQTSPLMLGRRTRRPFADGLHCRFPDVAYERAAAARFSGRAGRLPEPDMRQAACQPRCGCGPAVAVHAPTCRCARSGRRGTRACFMRVSWGQDGRAARCAHSGEPAPFGMRRAKARSTTCDATRAECGCFKVEIRTALEHGKCSLDATRDLRFEIDDASSIDTESRPRDDSIRIDLRQFIGVAVMWESALIDGRISVLRRFVSIDFLDSTAPCFHE